MKLIVKIKEAIESSCQSRWNEVVLAQREIFLENEGELMRKQADRYYVTISSEYFK